MELDLNVNAVSAAAQVEVAFSDGDRFYLVQRSSGVFAKVAAADLTVSGF